MLTQIGFDRLRRGKAFLLLCNSSALNNFRSTQKPQGLGTKTVPSALSYSSGDSIYLRAAPEERFLAASLRSE
jgi:hypothetical protein